MPLERTTWGGLSAIVVHEVPAGQSPELAIVLCHGFGAPAHDLVSLAGYFGQLHPELLTRAAFVFPGAPLDLTDRGLPGGSAWWWIDLDRFLNRPTPELLLQFRRNAPEGLAEARSMLMQLLDDASRELYVPPQRFVLGGFSQGSMLAVDCALRLPEPLAGLAILSGGLVNETEWKQLAASRGPLAVFQCHGRQDPILAFPQAQALHDLLVEAGSEVEFVAFNGGHEIPQAAVHRLAGFLMRILNQR